MEEKKIRPQDKWNEKAGLISKSYKLKRELVDEFAEACDKAGVSQAGQLSKMMRDFIQEGEMKGMERKIFVVINGEEREIKNLRDDNFQAIAKELGTDCYRLERVINNALDSFEDEHETKEMNIYGAEHLIVRGHGYYNE